MRCLLLRFIENMVLAAGKYSHYLATSKVDRTVIRFRPPWPMDYGIMHKKITINKTTGQLLGLLLLFFCGVRAIMPSIKAKKKRKWEETVWNGKRF